MVWDHTQCLMWTWMLLHEATHMSTVWQVVGGSKFKFWMQNKTDGPGSGDSETKLWLKPSWLKRKGQNMKGDSQKNVDAALVEQRRGVGHMEIKYSVCNEENSLCCIKFKLSGGERRASHPHRLPFLLSVREAGCLSSSPAQGSKRKATPLKLTSICTTACVAPLQHIQSYSSPYIPSTTSCWTAHKRLPFLHGTLPRPLNRLSPSSSPLLHNLRPLHGRYHIP